MAAGGDRTSNVSGRNVAPTVADLGLTRLQVHEARQLRDAEAAAPGVIRRTLDARLADGREPTKAAVAEYAEAMQAGAVFPPLVVFEEGDRFWLAEGFHRLGAYTAAGIAEVPCVVHQGGLRDAILHSAGANADHGVRRCISDRRRAVLMLVQDEEWGGWSDREIARRCAVSADLVGTVRRELTVGSDSEPATRAYRDRHGNVTQMNTARIGRQATEPAPVDPPAAQPPAAPSDDAGNVVVLGNRLTIMPSPGAVERHRPKGGAAARSPGGPTAGTRVNGSACIVIKRSEATMRVFQVRQQATGAILWTGAASSPIAALDAMAHEAGYYDHGDLPEHIRAGGLHAEEVRL